MYVFQFEDTKKHTVSAQALSALKANCKGHYT